MDETYRMLGKLHEADLEREAQKRRLAALAVRPSQPVGQHATRRTRALAFLRLRQA